MEGGGQKTETDALRELLPDQEELRKIAAQTDPNDFMRDLAQFGSVLGLNEGMPAGAPHFGTPNAHPVLDVSDSPRAASASKASAKPSAKPTKPAASPPLGLADLQDDRRLVRVHEVREGAAVHAHHQARGAERRAR